MISKEVCCAVLLPFVVSAVGWYPFQLFCGGLAVLGAVRFFFRLATANALPLESAQIAF